LPEAAAAGLLQENLRYLQQHVYRTSGIVLEDDKLYLFESRLSPLVRELGLKTLDELCGAIRQNHNTPLAQRVVEAMTTNETFFFRDPAQYEAIRGTLLPRLRTEKAATRRLRFWSAACSAGQEAYSLAMLLLEEGFGAWDVQILGTDFSTQMVDRARAAEYQQIEVNRGLPAHLLVKYFRRCGLHWRLSDDVKCLTRFDTIDLRSRLRCYGPFDLVFCRNVLIYFDQPTKRSILQGLAGTLFREGWLLLGGSETMLGLEDVYARKTAGSIVYYIPR
jgi:chemotaxis protein methyltransferase CheR